MVHTLGTSIISSDNNNVLNYSYQFTNQASELLDLLPQGGIT